MSTVPLAPSGAFPLIHIAFSRDASGKRMALARGVIAIGDTAVGLVAIGGFAAGGVAIAGKGVGVISLAGISAALLLAIGGVAFGGSTIGSIAFGIVATDVLPLAALEVSAQHYALAVIGRLGPADGARHGGGHDCDRLAEGIRRA